jgi:polyhydroxyalkanoate synthesis regulator phasin
MANILTSWKEIGQYLGKGVRTVQRWERDAGLPVRRRENHPRHAVMAIPEELDEWARSSTRGPARPVAETLRRELTALREETRELRQRVDEIEDTTAWMTFSPETTVTIRESRQRIRTRFLGAKQARARTIRARISFASTLCAMTETGFSSPGLDVPQRASQSIRNIRDCLDQPGYVPKNEVDELRGLLRKLEIRIELIAEELPENGYQRRA